jgi:hypothetical protein
MDPRLRMKKQKPARNRKFAIISVQRMQILSADDRKLLVIELTDVNTDLKIITY